MEKINTWFLYLAIFSFLLLAWHRNGAAERIKSDLIDSQLELNEQGAIPNLHGDRISSSDFYPLA